LIDRAARFGNIKDFTWLMGRAEKEPRTLLIVTIGEFAAMARDM